MTELEFSVVVASVALIAVLALAVYHDLVQHRIPNALTLAGLASALVIHSYARGFEGLLYGCAGAAVGLVTLLVPYVLKGMGAGDVKLMAAAGAFLGPANAFMAALLSLVFGAMLAVCVLLWRVIELRSATARAGAADVPGPALYFSLLQAGKERFPYAAAIAAGTIAAMWNAGLLESLYRSLA